MSKDLVMKLCTPKNVSLLRTSYGCLNITSIAFILEIFILSAFPICHVILGSIEIGDVDFFKGNGGDWVGVYGNLKKNLMLRFLHGKSYIINYQTRIDWIMRYDLSNSPLSA